MDESGDFGKYERLSPYYLLALVFHDQSYPLSFEKLEKLKNNLDKHFPNKDNTYVHARPIIRREKEFENYDLLEKRLFSPMDSSKWIISFQTAPFLDIYDFDRICLCGGITNNSTLYQKVKENSNFNLVESQFKGYASLYGAYIKSLKLK